MNNKIFATINKIFKNLKIAFKISYPNIKNIISIAMVLYAGIVSLNLPIFNHYSNEIDSFLLIIIISAIAIIILFIYSLFRVLSGYLTVNIFNNKKISIMIGDIQPNIIKIINSLDYNPSDIAFLFLYTMSGGIDHIYPNSAFDVMLHFLDNNFKYNDANIPRPRVQIEEEIQEYIKNKKTHNGDTPIDMNDIIEVPVYLSKDKKIFLLLLANYWDDQPDGLYSYKDLEVSIASLFNYIFRSGHYKKIFLYPFGTSSYDMPYLSVFSTLINTFATCCIKNKKSEVNHIIISCREKEFENQFDSAQLEKYVVDCSNFYQMKKF